MSKLITPEELEAAAQSLVYAEPSSLGVEVTLPVVYPNGQLVTVVVSVESGSYVVHDAGFGAMYLTSAGVRITRDLKRRLADLAARYECEFIENRMTRRCSLDQIALAMAMVANASRTVGDQALEVRAHVESDFRELVSERLREAVGATRVRLNESVKGSSGRTYRISNVVLDRRKSKTLAFVVPLPHRAAVLPHVGEFFDLQDAYPDIQRDSVYDDTADFRPEDRALLNRVGRVLPFAQSARFFVELAAV